MVRARWLIGGLIGASLLAGGLAAQQGRVADVVAALDRWTAAYLAGSIDLTNEAQALPRLPRWMVADPERPMGELLQFQQLVVAAIEVGTRAVTDRLLRLVDMGFDDDGGWRWDQRVVSDVIQAAIDKAGPDLDWHLFAIARGPEGDASRRATALRLLGCPRQRLFARALAHLLTDPQPGVRAAAATALGEMDEPGVLPALAMMLHVEDDDGLLAAALAAIERLVDVAATDPGVVRGRVLAIRAAAVALGRARDHALAGHLIVFLEEHRSGDSIPALIDALQRATTSRPAHPVEGRQLRDLRRAVHGALQAMTGAVLGDADVGAWRRLWASGGCAVLVRAPPTPDQTDGATAARRRDGRDGFFGVPVTGRRIVFVIDASGSMQQSMLKSPAVAHAWPSRFAIAVRELDTAVNALEPGTWFNIVVFQANARAMKEELFAATPDSKAAAVGWVGGNRPHGTTSLWDGLALALAMESPGLDGERDPIDEVFVLSDGIASSGKSGPSAATAMRVVRLARERGIRIHCVAIDAGGSGGLLREIAERSGGRFVRLGAR